MQKVIILMCCLGFLACKSKKDEETVITPPAQNLPVQIWTTSADGASLLQSKTIGFAAQQDAGLPFIQIDTTQTFQTVDGFGYTLTGGSAYLLSRMSPAKRAELLQTFFGKNAGSIGVSYLRISIGASDLDAEVFSYDDLPAGQTDPELKRFNLSKDSLYLIPVLKEILAIRPELKLMGSPWSAPVWMKTNQNSMGGNLKPEFYPVYARYFVKYLQAMQAQGITLDAITVQNEPQHGGNNPSMVMSATQQADFVKNHLGPAFQAAGLNTKIVIWDHNCDNAAYPMAVLSDPGAYSFVAGSAFHLYAGDVSALSQVHNAYPDKALYFTEQWTGSKGSFDGDFKWHLKNVVIGAMRNWSRTALEWNLANDPGFGPHTPGGCTECRGAVTISGDQVSKNVSYYIIAQASKFIPAGSVRIGSSGTELLQYVAFKTPEGKKVLLVLNESNSPVSFNVGSGSKWIATTLNAGSAATLVW